MHKGRLTVGVLSPMLGGAYFGAVLKGLARHVATLGGQVVAIQCGGTEVGDNQPGGAYRGSPLDLAKPLPLEAVSGFVIVTGAASGSYLSHSSLARSYLAQLRAQGKPVVTIGRHVPGVECPEVMPDERAGLADAIGHLVSHGHTRIAFAGPMGRAIGDKMPERRQVYLEALHKHGLWPEPALLFTAPSNLRPGGDAVGRALLDAGLPCTAVVCANDLIAEGLVHRLRSAGVALPSKMAVVGFDDRKLAAGLSPTLASIGMNFDQLGSLAARLLVDKVTGVPVADGEHLVKTSFVPRESCGCTTPSLADAHELLEANQSLVESLAQSYHVSRALVGMDNKEAEPKSLAWLEGTRARSGCLCLWAGAAVDEEPVHGSLRVAGVFGAALEERLVPGTTMSAAAFPPVDELTAQGCGPDDLVLVMPVRTASRDWGVLAVTGTPEAAASEDGDIYSRWTDLLGATLDRDALLEETRASEERYALAAAAANDGLWDWDIANGTVFYSSRWKSMLGYSDDEIATAPSEWFSRVHTDDREMLQELVAACLRGETEPLELEHRVRTKDGTYQWALCRAIAVRPEGLRATRVVGSLTDITVRKELEIQLRRAALYDALTGLPNRSLFMDRITQAFHRAKRSPGYQFCVLFMDLDGFKAVNDNWGHALGDMLLIKVADRLRSYLRENDTAVRFGGDEFAVLLDGVAGRKRMQAITHRLQTGLSASYSIEGHDVVVSTTIGTAISTTGYASPEDMIRDADAAMYHAKPGRRAPRYGPPVSPNLPAPVTSILDN